MQHIMHGYSFIYVQVDVSDFVTIVAQNIWKYDSEHILLAHNVQMLEYNEKVWCNNLVQIFIVILMVTSC